MMDAFEELISIHGEIDSRVRVLLDLYGSQLRCGLGCTDCCIDDVTIFEIEAERIRRSAAGLLETLRPHPPGMCAFLDTAGACRIYEHRPYVCRTQGLPLRWLEDDETGQVVERRDICQINDDSLPLLELPADQCWTVGEFEGRLATLQARLDGGELRRVTLRSLCER